MLAVETLDSATAETTVVLAHGFTQNARCWGAFGRLLAQRFNVVAVDAPGHGNSHHDEADLVAAGQLICEAGGSGHYIGYSMGGRMLLQRAVDDPATMQSLVLIGATAGIEEAAERTTRRKVDFDRAADVRRLGTAAFVDRWLKTPLFADLSREQACHDERLANRAEGLAASLENCGTGSMTPLWSRLSDLQMPVLVIAGTADTKFTEIGHRLVAAIGDNATFCSIDGGHATHLEKPHETASAIADWLLPDS